MNITQFNHKDKEKTSNNGFLFAETFPKFTIIHFCLIGIIPEFAIVWPKTTVFIG